MSRPLAVLAISTLLAGCERPLVQVIPARTSTVEATATSVEPGVVKARRDSILSVPVSGRIVEVFHRKGDRVKAGETLIRLENDMERIALDEAKSNLRRLEGLGPSNASEELIEQGKFALQRAQVNYERTFVRTPFEGILIELNANLGEMSYGTMPLNLVLGGKKGNTEESLARVVDDSKLYIEADIDEADAGRLRPCQVTRITVEALGGKTISGRLARISGAVSTSEGRSRTVRVEIDVLDGAAPATGPAAEAVTRADDPKDPPGVAPTAGQDPSTSGLLVGMSADIEVVIDRREGVVAVPTLVVLEGEEEKSVFVVEDGRLRRRTVKLGAANWELSEVREGLRAGELVVIPTDRRKLVEGLEVRTELREEKARP